MKTIFRNLGLGILMAGCIAVTGSQAFAQDAPAADVCKEVEAKQALYKQFTDNIPPTAAKPTVEQTETAIKAGDDYVQKYGACGDDKQIIDYFKQNLPAMKKSVEDIKTRDRQGAVLTKFDAAAKAKNVPEVFTTGKEILSKEADFPKVALDVMLTLVSAGYDQTRLATPVDTYNADTINYAKSAIQKIESGATSTNWGVWSYNFKNDKFKDGKAYTLGALNYIIGDITYSRLGKTDPAKKKEALAYFYKATQYDSFTKSDPFVYQATGAWYLDEAIRIDKERAVKLAANGNKDNEETLAMVGQQKGYADRAIDAYSRAYRLAKANPKPEKTVIDNLYTRLKELYAFRFDGKTDALDAAIAKADTSAFPDPSTPITPVTVEPTEPTTPATTGTTPATTGTTTPATDATKPAGTTTKPTATPKPATTPTTGATKPAGTATTDAATTDGKNAVKKTATPKKKGTR